MENQIKIIVSGVGGIGKTTAITHFKQVLELAKFKPTVVFYETNMRVNTPRESMITTYDGVPE